MASAARRTVIGALPAAALLAMGRLVPQARAQDAADFAEALAYSRDVAAGLAEDVRSANYPIDDERAREWQERDFKGRSIVAETAVELGEDVLLEYVEDDYRAVAEEMVARGVPLVPAPEEVVPIPTEAAAVEPECPDRMSVAWDILLDSMDLLEERDAVVAAIQALDQSGEHVRAIDKALEAGDLDRVVDALFSLLEFLMEGGVLQKLAETLGKRVSAKLLKQVALRLVPFVGTGYALCALGLACHRHWDRLTCDPDAA